MNAYLPHPAPGSDERETLRREINTQAREIGSRVEITEAEDVDALIEKAFSAIRSQRG